LKEKHKREGADSWAPLARDPARPPLLCFAPHGRSAGRRAARRPAAALAPAGGGLPAAWLGGAEARAGGGAGRRVGRRRGAPQRAGGGGGVRGGVPLLAVLIED